ncbi:hypothetical protein [Ancylobacter vacuolatus]|uniref:DNA-binding transcriptional MocR family regulator n=1 Tax=Ancylobacter vacuolatus TaxID=223389 RepID=A0ABU0DDW1_9HYPH|nr:hypothetical protein [Ancylobacter vacuolatus]MDQ0346572.1 DNA-binding transcriptional MocR family regulator [Ancylobacter vacuolatus]
MLLDALGLNLERRPDSPLCRQIYEGLAAEIRRRGDQAWPAAALDARPRPVARRLAQHHHAGLEQLAAEGYLEGLSCSGTYVSREPPAEVIAPAAPRINPAIWAAGSLDRSAELGVAIEEPEDLPAAFGGALAHAPQTPRHMRRPAPFRSNFPALDAFPVALWAKLAADLYRQLDADTANHLMGEGDPQGYAPLRAAIAVMSPRGVASTARPTTSSSLTAPSRRSTSPAGCC